MRPEIWHYHGILALHGVLPSLAGREQLGGVICTVMDGPHRIPCRTVPPALAGAAQLRADGIPSSCYLEMYTSIRRDLHHKWQVGAAL